MNSDFDPQIRLIPVKQIVVLNPRQRGKTKFAQISANIAKPGLKRPITVSHVEGKNGHAVYNLVCGQGRLEAYIALGEQEIPAVVIDGSKEELLLMSLAENIARRQHSTVELVREIGGLKERGYSFSEIATKTDLDISYVRAILQLLAKGEEKLLQAVEKGQIPVSIAITIATSDDAGIQRALTEAYERNDLRGKALLQARRLIENRRSKGKRVRNGKRPPAISPVSTNDLLKAYQKETFRQKLTIQRAKVCETRLLFTVNALKQLFKDEHFVTLLRAEGLDSLPQYLVPHVLGAESNL
ncbi:ParB/RepB/Spo0J family partition protein [Schlesneria sp. T3-172]|uniref:ParB/RepB/Spo0J family partition protein n=1 Tax=Schlesneria sphaerica TaxID=3373610 RepID=UPI0037CA6CAA